MATKQKRKRGRPTAQKYFSPTELKAAAQENLKKSQERMGAINFKKAEEGLELMLDEARLKKCTKTELKELRRLAEGLWEKFQAEKQYAEDQAWEGGYGTKREPVEGMMSSEEWDEEHKFLKKKRKNAKPLHNIYSLPEHKREERGLATEPVPMEFDVDATEAEIEQRLMEQARVERQQDQQFLKGRRVSGRPKADPNATQKKNFWV